MSDCGVELAERKWLVLIKKYIEILFTGFWMPSHDIQHHARVWRNACFLAQNLKTDDPDFYEKLLLASFFHDIGLLVNMGSSHGLESRKACELFLQTHSGMVQFETNLLLKAIENHDDKEYLKQNIRTKNLIYSVLTVADDMDAFGAIGAYRYIEICLLRGMQETQIPGHILTNASRRYANCLRFMKDLNLNTIGLDMNYTCLKRILSEESFVEKLTTFIAWINNEIVTPKRDPYLFFKETEMLGISGERKKFFTNRFLSESNVLD